MIDSAKLRQLADAATGGNWYDDSEMYKNLRQLGVFAGNADTDAAFIAATSPTAVLALLDEVARLQEDSDARDFYQDEAVRLCSERDDAYARIAELEASNRACVSTVAEWGARAGALRAEVDRLKQHVKSQMDINGRLIGITNKHSALARSAEDDKEGIRDAIAVLTDENEQLRLERDEAREAVNRLAGALEDVSEHRGWDDHDMTVCARSALADPVVHVILKPR